MSELHWPDKMLRPMPEVKVLPDELREIRNWALSSAVYVGPDLGEFNDDDDIKAERIVMLAKRFERFIIEGQ